MRLDALKEVHDRGEIRKSQAFAIDGRDDVAHADARCLGRRARDDDAHREPLLATGFVMREADAEETGTLLRVASEVQRDTEHEEERRSASDHRSPPVGESVRSTTTRVPAASA